VTEQQSDPVSIDVKPSINALTFEHKMWLCPECGVKRNIGNHARCSKITQLKHRKERDKRPQK
jgi:transposase